ncbi:C2H2 type zinc finger domain-containing protein [Diaporthe amygdali]|uniref:C2H2 type zinc finger domain-containing protein n=1 Tax=Phomopsis amygdali TaxID=1214568 RepID=UPI0022FE5FDB|nr:C2H2 type zinc finger domain-containing protein [Diaporthe amygdali]KAJ0119132.1 C2H2 type zinc finger domain-containing protein [Diaporthe amygdali]
MQVESSRVNSIREGDKTTLTRIHQTVEKRGQWQGGGAMSTEMESGCGYHQQHARAWQCPSGGLQPPILHSPAPSHWPAGGPFTEKQPPKEPLVAPLRNPKVRRTSKRAGRLVGGLNTAHHLVIYSIGTTDAGPIASTSTSLRMDVRIKQHLAQRIDASPRPWLLPGSPGSPGSPGPPSGKTEDPQLPGPAVPSALHALAAAHVPQRSSNQPVTAFIQSKSEYATVIMADQASFAIPEPRSASTFIAMGDRGLQLPASSFTGSMDGRPRPLEPDLNSGGIVLPAPISGFIDPLGDLQSSAINRNPQSPENFVRPATRNPILDWYTSQEKPWDPIQGRTAPLPRAGDLRGGKLNYRPSGPAYSVYRETHVPSECETTGPGALPSDSGYHSRATQSVFNGSTCGDIDRSGENGSISSHLAGLQVDRPAFSSETWRQASLQATPLPLSVESGNLVCPTCRQNVKTKSELKKHKQKHEKPHRCDVPGCTRTEGFSTPNDVDRHKRSCHPDQDANGKYYRCIVDGCRKKDKKWPRADNFRQHLKRVHMMDARDDDLEAYIYKDSPRADTEFAGLGSVGDGLRMDASHPGSAIHSSNWPFLDLRTTLQAIQEQAPRDSSNLGYPGQQMDPYQDGNVTQQQLHFMTSNGTDDQLSRAAMQISPADSANESVSSQLEDTQSEPQEQDALEHVHRASPNEQFIESDYLNDGSTHESELCDEEMPSITQVDLQIPATEEPRRNPEDIVRPSQGNNDSISSESESGDTQESLIRLEDHASQDTVSLGMATTASVSDQRMSDETVNAMQAHYGTGLELSTDGSSIINDRNRASELIKALENQGTLAELLEELGYHKPRESENRTLTAPSLPNVIGDLGQVVCDEPNCGKIFPRPCELKLDYCRVGRDGESRFWCGFCKAIVETKGRDLKAGIERFNHIDDHYSGRNAPRMDISEWKSMDPEFPTKDMSSPGSGRDNLSGSSQAVSAPSTSSANGRKREAISEVQQPRSRKRQRAAQETMWFCPSQMQQLQGPLRSPRATIRGMNDDCLTGMEETQALDWAT